MAERRGTLWAARGLIGTVLAVNLSCAALFLWRPADYAPAFELSGAIGAGLVRGLGVLFLMWNVPYAAACWNPVRNRISLYEATAMQAVGLLGEALIWAGLPAAHQVARQTLARFAVFDLAGLALLLLAGLISRQPRPG